MSHSSQSAGQNTNTDDDAPISPTTDANPFEESFNQHDYSPRSSISLLPQFVSNNHHLKENYRGFHANKRPKGIGNVPPLSQPIKPRFKKKGSSLLNKLIYSNKKDDANFIHSLPQHSSSQDDFYSSSSSRNNSIHSGENEQRKSNSSASSSGSKYKFRLPSFTDFHSLQMTEAEPKISIDLNLNEMQDIVKDEKPPSQIKSKNWQAPDSWDVKAPKEVIIEPSAVVEDHGTLPVLYGSKQASHVVSSSYSRPSHIIRVFKEDNTFTTILCPLETTTSELLATVQKKFFLESTNNYQISVHIGNCVKVLEDFEKPLKIQMGLLLLSGFKDEDNLKIIGREDLSYICKFVVENIYLRSLTHDEEVLLSRNYVDVNISSLNLKNIPIIFHQHTYEIESLNVADNPSIYIPLDFIQSCTNLTKIIFSKNGCSVFPTNFLEAKRLTTLDLEMNFLDDLPNNINLLENLTTLKLNSNQLSTLPKSFGQLINLTSLNLSSNYFNKYPEPIDQLSNLIDLDLSYNDLSSLPESITNLKFLQKLNLCTNKLSKALPNHLSKLVSLKRLDLRYNLLTNVDVLGYLPNLEVTYASKNNISGFSDQMKSLRLLNFDRNPITELKFSNVMQMLNILDLSRAKITSFPPECVEYIPNIEKLVLDRNHLVTLPHELGQLKRLAYLSIYSNNLQMLPSSIGELQNLQYLDLHSNNLQAIPQELWNCKSLSILNLSSNNLTSFYGKGLLNESLLVLTLSDNRLSDDCFESISLLMNLKSLNLSYNDLIEIPEGALKLPRLTELYLSGNDLTNLPGEDLQDLQALKLLYINNNKLVSLPSELSKIKPLQHFDVGSNQLKYNISNWPYDWNWHWNQNLRYLNFSGNKRFEIKQTHIKNPESGQDFDSLLVLKHLKVLGLIDVTLTTTSVPDQSVDMRIRTTASELDNIGYGVSDSMGMREHVSNRDLFVQKFRGNENELLVCVIDGKHGISTKGHKISHLTKSMFVSIFTHELEKNIPEEALRRSFLQLNKDLNGALSAMKNGLTVIKEFSELSQEDLSAGCALTVVYIKDKELYSANVGDIQSLLCRNNGDYKLLTTRHDPTNRPEFERIRASGGYVSGTGDLDSDLNVSRGVGFFNFLPHTNSNPDITKVTLTVADEFVIIATKTLWEYISYELSVDIIRQSKEPMVAAQKLRDFAICYGASDKISVIVLTFGKKQKQSNNLYNNLGTRRRDRQLDSTLRRLESEIEPPIGELALVFTDIKNSTLLWDSYPAPMRSAIKTHNSIMRRQLRIIGGYEVKTEGDAFMVAFPSPSSALLWCFNVQQNLLTADWPSEILETDQCCEVTDGLGNVIFRGLSVRMGIHWGSPVCEPDVVTGRMDYFGPMVNRASRISAIADGGQIAVSSDFLDEMRALTSIHDDIKINKKTLTDAYQGNENAGKIIEKELNSLEEHECNYYKIGERKLKGLETPETVTLVYTNKLKLRFEIFQKRFDQNHSTRVVGTLPVEAIYGIRTVSLRLENICANINDGTSFSEGFENSSGIISQRIPFKEVDLVSLLNHLVTRIESCTATLYMRQQLGGIKNESLSKVLEDLKKLVEDSKGKDALH
ncbi:unnamed protein product [Candida verbasci]|uniref:Adenylate cyclase n=1 Tax=Candida verbasci TaxID=1227364 RepID=A0A9W4TZD1_9ASCO|nr:unnamed protein product [Candida verbasci]